jgi:hypothetical protein
MADLSGIGAGLQGLTAGLQGGFSMGTAITENKRIKELQERRTKIQGYEQFTKAAELFRTDPGLAEPLLKELMGGMQLPEERQKDIIGQLKKGRDENVQGMISLLRKYSLNPDAMTVNQLLRLPPSQQMQAVQSLVSLQSEADLGAALRGEAPGGQGPEVQEAQGGAATQAAELPTGSAPPSGGMEAGSEAEPQMQALPAPQFSTPSGQSFAAEPVQMQSPAAGAARSHRNLMTAAATLERSGRPGSVANAAKLRQQAEGLENNTWVQMTPGQLQKAGYKPGAVGFINLATGAHDIKQPGEDQVATISGEGARRYLGDAYKEGDTITVTKGAGGVVKDIRFLREGKDQLEFVSGDSDLGKKLNANPDALIKVNKTTGDIIVQEKGTQRFRYISRAQAAEEGLDATTAYKEKLTGTGERTGDIEAVRTGVTEADPTLKALTNKDAERLTEIRKETEAASEIRRSAELVRELQGQFTTGPTANWRLFAGQLMQEFGISGEYVPGTAAGEALEAEFGKNVLGRASEMKGLLSDKDVTFLQRSGPQLLKSPEGNELIVEILDLGASRKQKVGDLAEEWAAAGVTLSRGRPEYGGKNYYQVRKSILDEGLPTDLRDRINKVGNYRTITEETNVRAFSKSIDRMDSDELERYMRNSWNDLNAAQRSAVEDRVRALTTKKVP